MKRLFCTLVCVGGITLSTVVPSTVQAQEKKTAEKTAYWGKSDLYLQKQASVMLNLVDQALDENPPVAGAPMIRKLALYNFDAIVHETKYDYTEPFNTFVKSRIDKVIADLQKPVKKGMRVYKLYNECVVARTKSVTIAFDIVRRKIKTNQIFFDEDIRKIVDQCDVMFLTHNHPDHVDPVVVDMFLKAGKPVMATANILKKKTDILHRRSDKVTKETLKLANGKELLVTIFPGHQSELINNIYAVTTPEKLTIAHAGDQYNKEDMEWIANAKNDVPKLNALFINCWTHRMSDVIAGFNPKVVITGHENEMGHTIDHREAFWLTFQKMEQITTPYVVMGWGEWYNVK